MLMNKISMVLALFIAAMNANAQDQLEDQMNALRSRGFGARNAAAAQQGTNGDSVKVQKDSDPYFPGGEIFLEAYLKKKITHSNVSGTGEVVVSFMVDKKGNIYGAEVAQSSGNNALDTAAYNIVTGMPHWKPGYADGVPADKPAQVTISFGKKN